MVAGEAAQESVLPSGRQEGPVQPLVTVTVAEAVAAWEGLDEEPEHL